MPAPTSTRTAWKGAISFALVHIPIALHSATQDIRPKMHMIDKKTNAQVGHKNYDKSTGKEVAKEDIVKGMETDKGHFVVLSKEEIQEALPKTTGTDQAPRLAGRARPAQLVLRPACAEPG